MTIMMHIAHITNEQMVIAIVAINDGYNAADRCSSESDSPITSDFWHIILMPVPSK